ncbi:glycosyltransferase [Flavobacterium sp. DG2-3]|uniref:glycosyltransferase n=1 Tax=Flavobacterium sp. DG2-3 TaxID=3068317 RepID=UPI002740078D|nr:glycosyltransferase [Flavobacterium sp. DG2-3]MDP5200681.1 glycosyltransferase [Flavobacterium sp. DG2-3]
MNNKVSIFILTYNQEKFIGQTLESILSQKTNFEFQLVIGEDHSTDSTRIICEKYAKENPIRIKLLPSLECNIGLIKNYIRTIQECDGKYIAICDGDDYWIDDQKLQKQVDFLESNPDFSIIYTNIELLFKDGTRKIWEPIISKKDTQFDDLVFANHIPSVSVLFKNNQSHTEKLPSWILKYPFGDWPTYLWTIRNGGCIHYLNEITAVYRIDAGISTEMRRVNSNILKINLNILQDVFQDNDFASKKEITAKAILNLKKSLMLSFNRENRYHKGFIQFLKNLKETGVNYIDLKMYLYSIYKSFI